MDYLYNFYYLQSYFDQCHQNLECRRRPLTPTHKHISLVLGEWAIPKIMKKINSEFSKKQQLVPVSFFHFIIKLIFFRECPQTRDLRQQFLPLKDDVVRKNGVQFLFIGALRWHHPTKVKERWHKGKETWLSKELFWLFYRDYSRLAVNWLLQ